MPLWKRKEIQELPWQGRITPGEEQFDQLFFLRDKPGHRFCILQNMKNFLLAIFLMGYLTGYSQTETGVAIIKDPRLDLLIKKQVELNRQVYLMNNRTGAGYRVLVVSTNDRAKAFEVKSRLMSTFPEHKTYLFYQSPYFKIQIGNFRERNEAADLRQQILKLYPTGVIIVPATVEFKPEAEELGN